MQTTTQAMPSSLALWYGILAGPLAAAVNEGLNYMLDQHSCSTGHYYVLHLISTCALLFCLSATFVAGHELRHIPGDIDEEGGTWRERSWFMARLGLAASLGFALVIIAMSVPHFILSPCD